MSHRFEIIVIINLRYALFSLGLYAYTIPVGLSLYDTYNIIEFTLLTFTIDSYEFKLLLIHFHHIITNKLLVYGIHLSSQSLPVVSF